MSKKEKKTSEKIMVSSLGCAKCESYKKILKKDIDSGILKVYKMGTKKGDSLISKLKIKYLPYLAYQDPQTNKYKRCKLKDGKVVCK